MNILRVFGLPEIGRIDDLGRNEIRDRLVELVQKRYEEKEQSIGADTHALV